MELAYEEYEFFIDPVAKGRPKFSTLGGVPRAYTDSKTRTFESTIKQIANLKRKGRPCLEGPIKIVVTFFLKKPKSVKKRFPTVRPDTDNFIKSLLDALNGVIWLDDSQVVDLHASKAYSDTGSIKLEVLELTQF